MTRTGRPKLSEDVEYICQNCGKVYRLPAWQTDGTKFCKSACYHASRKGRPQPWLLRREMKICPRCGNEFEVGGTAGKREQKYCGVKCAGTSKYPEPLKLSREDAAYLAGFFDGEGNIIQLKKSAWRISLYQSHEPVIRWVAEITGTGFVAPRDPNMNGRNLVPRRTDYKIAWIWQLYGRNAALLLRQLRPYLHVKADQADAMLDHYFPTQGRG